MQADTLRFSTAARVVALEARQMGLCSPTFCSPPGVAGATRTIRRSNAGTRVAVAVRGRPLADVVADLVEGVVMANGLSGADAVRCRHRLAGALDAAQRAAARPTEVASRRSPGWRNRQAQGA
jgi:hypothetical protein